jgi:hypothetical protein
MAYKKVASITCPRCGWRMRDRVEELKQRLGEEGYPNAFKVWTSEEDMKLEQAVREGASMVVLAKMFGRPPTAIRRRLTLLGLELQAQEKPETPDAPVVAYQVPEEPH